MLDSQAAEINTLKQINLDFKLAIHKVPCNIDKADVINTLSRWSNSKLDDTTITHSSLSMARDKRSASLYMEFCNKNTRNELLKFCKSSQRDPTGKYSPVTAEMVFNLSNKHTGRGLEMQFRELLTDTNRKILSQIRANRDIIGFHWLNNGYYMIKKAESSTPVRILSLQHLNEIILKWKDAMIS